MEIKKGHSKKHLNFRALRDCLGQRINQIPDKRNQEKCNFSLYDIYMSGFAMFFFQTPALLDFQRRMQKSIHTNNLKTIWGIEAIPSDTHIRKIIDEHNYEPLMATFQDYFKKLQRNKILKQYKFLDEKYLVAVDGSEYFRSEAISCKKCLIADKKEGTQYYHQILQATIVHPDKREVLPMAPEFIRNGDGDKKQDCERNAAKRLIKKIKQNHKMLALIITGDALYSNQPFVENVIDAGYSYILTCKPADHKVLFEDIEGLRAGKLLDRYEYTNKQGRRNVYEWVNSISLNGNKETISVNFVDFKIYNAKGDVTYHNSFITDLEISVDTVTKIVAGGRARWKIENETFNTLKNHGYHLEHNFGHGEKNLSEAFFILNLLAFFTHQIFQLTDKNYQNARAEFSSRKEYWNSIRAYVLKLSFEDWEKVLQFINTS